MRSATLPELGGDGLDDEDLHWRARLVAQHRDVDLHARPDYDLFVPEVSAAIEYEETADIGHHAFFTSAARGCPAALVLWAQQEYIVSSHFSQVLYGWMQRIENVHVRTLVQSVAAGEHHALTGGLAISAHPSLARRLCVSLDTDFDGLVPLRATVRFMDAMARSADEPMAGAGFLGIGNERMLIPEYVAVRRAFLSELPEADFFAFLDANIEDDKLHHQLIERAASGMVSLGSSAADFLRGAEAGVDSRIEYYNRLAEICADPTALEASVSLAR